MANQIGSQSPTIEQHLKECSVSRRSFLQLCTALMVTAPVGLGVTSKANALEVAQTIGKAKRPSVIWLHFQDCLGCSETLLRTSRPDVADLILNVISLDYHETLMAASGYQAEAALKQRAYVLRRQDPRGSAAGDVVANDLDPADYPEYIGERSRAGLTSSLLTTCHPVIPPESIGSARSLA